MYVAVAVVMTGTGAEAILLHARAVVDGVQEALFRQQCQGAEHAGVVGRDHLFHDVLQGEGPAVHLLDDGLQHQQAHGGYADACL